MQQERGHVCGVENCRSGRYHIAEDGYTYCSNGHRAEAQLLTQDEFENSQGARRTRKQAEERQKEATVYEGRQALELYLQCFQLVLWKQLYWLVHTSGYAAELETVVRDLWALRLQLLEKLISDASQEASVEQYFSSQSAGDDDEVESIAKSAKLARYQKIPELIETVSLCYIGLILMRLPITARDVRQWVLSEGFPFLRASKDIPTLMKTRLPSYMLIRFKPQAGLAVLDKLHNTIMSLAGALQISYGMKLPKINHPLLLYRFISELCLPLHIFPATERLLPLVGNKLDFTANSSSALLLSAHPEVQLASTLVIAVKLIHPFDDTLRFPTSAAEPAALNLDWRKWAELHQRKYVAPVLDMGNEGRIIAEKDLLDITEVDIMDLSGEEIDKYLDWYQRTWIEEEDSTDLSASQRGTDVDFRNALYKMFPVAQLPPARARANSVSQPLEEETGDSAQLQRTEAVTASLRPIKVVPMEDQEKDKHLRPGSHYKNYRTIADVPKIAIPFLKAVAGLVGLDLPGMVLAVYQTEVKLQRWYKRGRKKTREERDEEDE